MMICIDHIVIDWSTSQEVGRTIHYLSVSFSIKDLSRLIIFSILKHPTILEACY
jgi:hypothetical protein